MGDELDDALVGVLLVPEEARPVQRMEAGRGDGRGVAHVVQNGGSLQQLGVSVEDWLQLARLVGHAQRVRPPTRQGLGEHPLGQLVGPLGQLHGDHLKEKCRIPAERVRCAPCRAQSPVARGLPTERVPGVPPYATQ